jgi:benzoate/toluate 1,2-dioxygenase alpha subunit/2,4,5-trichlorophenoxyacetic acid oxygenase 1
VSELSALLDDRPGDGVFRVHRRAYLDPEVFALEMKHVFEATWLFLGLESQIPKPHDFFTASMGRQPVIVQRGADGAIGAFLNSCRHRGSIVCPERAGNRARHVCRYHGWTYDSGGRCVGITHQDDGLYPRAFASESHDLARVARVASYRGLVFGSLAAEVPPLEEHLGEARAFIDLVADQSPQGLEFVPGTITYTFDANWKLQFENGLDFYHFAVTHASYVEVYRQRQAKHGAEAPPRWAADEKQDQGTFWFERGHALMWSNRNSLRVTRPIQHDPAALEALRARVGAARAKWMQLNRNLTIYPNLQLIDVSSMQLRI